MFDLHWQLLFDNGFDNVHTTFFVHKQYLSEGATAFEPTEHDVHVLVYGGIKLKKKDNKKELCSDEVLFLTYSIDGMHYTIQKIDTFGKSPGGLYGHSAELLYDVNQNLPGVALNRNDILQKRSATRMVVVGGLNPSSYVDMLVLFRFLNTMTRMIKTNA